VLEKLMNSPIAWLILSVLAIASFIYAIICQKVNKERKEITYANKTNILIENNNSFIDKLSIKYDNKEISGLCISRIAIWNSGNRVINSNDIANGKELCISMNDENQILDSTLVFLSEETNKFKIKKVNNTAIKLLFDYIEPKHGAIIQIIHTGTKKNIDYSVKIKGGKQLKNYYDFIKNKKSKPKNKSNELANLISMSVASLTILYSCIKKVLKRFGIIELENSDLKMPFDNPTTIDYMTDVGILLIYIVISIIMIRLFIKSFKSSFYTGMPDRIREEFSNEEGEL